MTSYPVQNLHSPAPLQPALRPASTPGGARSGNSRDELKEAFQQFAGQTFFGQMLQSLRKTVDKPAYFHGGRAEEVFQAQLDQVLAQEMTEKTADTFAGPMFELFNLSRPN